MEDETMAMNINVNVSSSGLRAGSRTYKIPDIKTQKVNLTQKMHHYEGYRIPDGTDMSKLSNAHIVMNSKGEKYVVSENTAQQMDSDGELAGACVIFSSMFSCLTMFGWIFALKSLGMF